MVINIGENYDITFNYKGDPKVLAEGVITTVEVGAELTVNSITASPNIGSAGLTPDIYILGNTLPGSEVVLTVNVTVNTESGLLPVKMTVTTDNVDTDLNNNSYTKNLVTELNGFFCSELSSCLVGAFKYYEELGLTTGMSVVLPFTPSEDFPVSVYRNGIRKNTTEYTRSGATIVFVTTFGGSPFGEAGETVQVDYRV